MKNIRAELVEITGKDGRIYRGVKFFVMTSQGEWESKISFPSLLEYSLVKQALDSNSVGAIYSENNEL